MSFNVYMVRHGQTYLNLYHRMQGWSDAPLTEKGQNDGKHAGQLLSHVKFDAAYSSDLARAQTTGRLILAENPSTLTEPVARKEFREEFFGYWEGYDDMLMWHQIGSPKGGNTYNELVEKFGLQETTDLVANADQYHDAETYAQLWERIQAGMQLLRDNAKDGDNILLVTHGTYLRHIMDHYSDTIGAFPGPRNGSVTKLVVDNDSVKVLYTDRLDNIE
ncbi:histidine phosphatase family protein [Furfurilactobacillus milii]|uniref:Histidine phosphatase family protein n=1 Tax=Furfurilactobacillus rossiae TaxID=231049 RepID=A0A7C9IT36_9LACO|nr:histidine phosphatase family protein [Furfurilactobacillus milii]MYV05596.1 histidine phosphatase family protein [Furfurilactobacillus milii]